MRAVLLTLAGCAIADPSLVGDPAQSEAVAAISACPAGQWCVETSPVAGTLLHGVWARDASDVFAVGDSGTILRRTGDVWSVMASGTTNNLRGVWGTGSSDVWVGGVSGTILHFDGTAWSAVTGATSDVDSVWGSGPSDVWFAGSSTVLHWNGTALAATSLGGILLSVSGVSPSDVWVTGENTNLHHFTGTTWTTVNPGAGTSTLFTVLALSASEVWTTDFMPGNETVHLIGGKWVTLRTNNVIFNSMSALAPNDLWAAGGRSIGHWNGSAWTIEQPFSNNLWSIATMAGNAWVVGSGALIGHRTL